MLSLSAYTLCKISCKNKIQFKSHIPLPGGGPTCNSSHNVHHFVTFSLWLLYLSLSKSGERSQDFDSMYHIESTILHELTWMVTTCTYHNHVF